MLLELRQAPGKFEAFAPRKTESQGNFRVIIIDNDTNTYEQVISVCMKALGIAYREAFEIALAVDQNGRAEVFEGSMPDAEAVAGVIRSIGIEVLVVPVS